MTKKNKIAGVEKLVKNLEPKIVQTPPESPTLFDLDAPKTDIPEIEAENSPSPQFDFGKQNDAKKDSILAQLRDLHATSEPDLKDQGDQPVKPEKPVENKSKKDPLFGLFDDISEPKIEPKEKRSFRPESGDDVDQLLNLKPGRKKSAKKPFDWEFSDATNNLHDGKAANGLNYKKSQKKG